MFVVFFMSNVLYLNIN